MSFQTAIKKVLIVRFSSIGDIVLTTPVPGLLKKKYPNAEIHFLTKQSFQSVLNNNPNIDKIWGIKKDINEINPQLKKEQFSIIVDLHKNLRTLHLKKVLGVKSLSFNKLNWEKWLVTNFKINRLPNVHIVDRYVQVLNKLDIQKDESGLDFYLSEKDKITAANLIEGKEVVAIVIGAAHKTKEPPVALISKIILELNHPVALIGGKAEVNKANAIVNSLIGTKTLVNLVGKLSIGESAAVLGVSQLVITPDTGMMHIAAALHKRIISLWGNTIPEFGMTPYYGSKNAPHWIAQVKNLPCRPCSKIGHESCPKSHFNCMNLLDGDEIVKQANLLLQSKNV